MLKSYPSKKIIVLGFLKIVAPPHGFQKESCCCSVGVSKKTGEPENRKPGNRGPGSGSGLEKPKTGYPGSGTRFLPGYREPG
jgi:hypothetical protein